MNILKAQIEDIPAIIEITKDCRSFLKSNGIPQWQGIYPNEETYLEDIKQNRLYVLKDEDRPIAMFALVYPDHNYDYIEDGKWLNDAPYIAIHRMGIFSSYRSRGYAKFIFDYVKSKYSHIRVDTHKLNERMNKSLKNSGFIYTGVVYMEDKTPRNAYEWIQK